MIMLYVYWVAIWQGYWSQAIGLEPSIMKPVEEKTTKKVAV